MSKRLDLSDVLQYFNEETVGFSNCIRSALACLNQWLICEYQCNNGLDFSSGVNSLLNLPSVLISLLQLSAGSSTHPLLIESDLQPVLQSFLQVVSGDEAFVRPLGSILAQFIMHGKHWRTRLSSIRLLQFLIDELHSNDSTGSPNCVISDTLVALSEALEDSNSEVEVEANKLFAHLDQMGLTSTSGGCSKTSNAESDLMGDMD